MLTALIDVQGQIVLGVFLARRQELQSQARQAQLFRVVAGIGVEHGLEDRAVAGTARWLERFHHQIEWRVLIARRFQHQVAHLGHDFIQARVSLQTDTQRQGIGKEADQPLYILAVTIGGNGADHHVLLAAHAGQQHGPGGHQGHEWRRGAQLGKGTDCARQLLGQSEFQGAAFMALHRRTRPVGGHRQQGWRAAQVIAPELQMLRLEVAIHALALPGGVVGILNRQGRQRIGLVADKGFIKGRELPDQHFNGPAIGNDVVLGDQQQVFFIGHLQQATANQRPLEQVERLRSLGLAEPGGTQACLFRGLAAQILLHQHKAAVGSSDDLHRLFAFLFKGRAQAFVARHQMVECRLECCSVQRAGQAQGRGHVIGNAGGVIELVEEPQALLGERQWQRGAAVCRFDCILRRTLCTAGTALLEQAQQGSAFQQVETFVTVVQFRHPWRQ
ncbi:hypothetical protein PSCICP_39800 [Pseudomonas cichorii]|uniref:Uncharacterized protein n=1 Tax=Pseudomonas cichorii TaxID=36746 RepID=A0ABQ1DSX0_PSECI|nr:hypothetical protein PSCICP_39800 [Pseudomonas cichorii]